MTDRMEILKKLWGLDRRMMSLPVGKADAEYETLEVEYNKLSRELYPDKEVK